MTSLAEYFQAFHSYAYENTLTANTRALYYTILGEFNNAYWKRSELSKSVRELRVIGGFKSESIVQRAKAQLGSENILQISKGKTGDVYRLVEPSEWKNAKIPIGTQSEHDRNAIGTQSERNRNTCGTLEGVSNYACAKDNKDSKDKEDIKDFFTTTAATRARERKRSVNSAEVQQAWFECEGEKLKGGVAFGLIDLENEYGTQVLIDAIFAAHQANTRPRLSFNFVKAVLENRQKGDKPRGKIIRLDSVPTDDDQLAGGAWGNAGLPPGVKSRFGNNGESEKV